MAILHQLQFSFRAAHFGETKYQVDMMDIDLTVNVDVKSDCISNLLKKCIAPFVICTVLHSLPIEQT